MIYIFNQIGHCKDTNKFPTKKVKKTAKKIEIYFILYILPTDFGILAQW